MDAPRSIASARRSRAIAILVLAGCSVLAIRGLTLALQNRVALGAVLGGRFGVLLLGLVAGVLLALVALALECAALRRGAPRTRPLAPLGALIVVLVATWGLFLAFVQPFQRIWFEMTFAGAAGACAALLLVLERGFEGPRMRRAGPITLALCTAVVVSELATRGIAAVWPSPLFARAGDGPRRHLERFRCKPGLVHFGFSCNRSGYYDTDFYRKAAGERLVLSIGDSFNVGSVPHSRHFTTVCEAELGIPVHNLGVAGAGPPEYLCMLVDDGMPLAPDVVVVDVFVGNDLTHANVEEGLPDAGLRSWFERQRVLLCVLPQRLARIAAERSRRAERGSPVAMVQGEHSVQGPSSFPWLADPRLEEASLSEAAFLRLETQRALDNCRGDPASFASFCESMLAMKQAAGSTPLCVMLIPDEFQVEDELWRAVLERANTALDRDRPQRLVGRWLEANAIPYLDLLPVFRSVPPLEDGRRHLYHLRDTHWNARGNAVAGEALARFLEPRIAR